MLDYSAYGRRFVLYLTKNFRININLKRVLRILGQVDRKDMYLVDNDTAVDFRNFNYTNWDDIFFVVDNVCEDEDKIVIMHVIDQIKKNEVPVCI